MTNLAKDAYEARLANRAIDLEEMKRLDPEFKARWERLIRSVGRVPAEALPGDDSVGADIANAQEPAPPPQEKRDE